MGGGVSMRLATSHLKQVRQVLFSMVPRLLFPEGTDLSKSNLEKSHTHAAKENLQKYQQAP